MRRLLVLAALMFALPALDAPKAASQMLLWDFNDFPAFPGGPLTDEVFPTEYGCGGKTYCTYRDVFYLNQNGGKSIAKEIDGVSGMFSRPLWQAPGVYSQYDLLNAIGGLGGGNIGDLGQAHAYLADFSAAFTSAAVDISRPWIDLGPQGVYGVFLDMWSGPGGSGDLLARAESTPGVSDPLTLSVDAPMGATARSLTFGRFLVGNPGCVYGPYGRYSSVLPCLYAQPPLADNVRISPVPPPSPTIEVTPRQYEYGPVNIGTTAAQIVAIANLGDAPLEVTDVALLAGSGVGFALADAPSVPFEIEPNGTVEINLLFAPLAAETATATLVVTSGDFDQPVVDVQLSGRGVSFKDQATALLAFFDASVESGDLVENDRGPWAAWRLQALRNMIGASGDLLDRGRTTFACIELELARRRSDGLFPPPDFVSGPAAPDLEAEIAQLRSNLRCDALPRHCGLGAELALLLPFLGLAARRIRSREVEPVVVRRAPDRV